MFSNVLESLYEQIFYYSIIIFSCRFCEFTLLGGKLGEDPTKVGPLYRFFERRSSKNCMFNSLWEKIEFFFCSFA
jgi:hypothetical protein